MQNFVDIYKDIKQKRVDCQSCCVLIKVGHTHQCGLILTCDNKFCYVLTTKINMQGSAKMDVVITFGDLTETYFNAEDVVVYNSERLSIVFLCGGMETVPIKQPGNFRVQENVEEHVVYKLSYIPKALYNCNGCVTQCNPASVCLRAGNLGIVDLQNEEVDIFYHNCCAGTDVTTGSVVFNGNCEIIGMNLHHAFGWTSALNLNAIKEDIGLMFPVTRHKTFAGIQEYLKKKGAVEALTISFRDQAAT